MTDSLLHEIQQAFQYENERDIEFKAERFIRQWVVHTKPYIMDELYVALEDKIFQNNSTDDEIAIFKMMQVLIKRKVTF